MPNDVCRFNTLLAYDFVTNKHITFVYTTSMKRTVVYPEWAEKYREKGRTLRKVRDGYGLYQCTSEYVKGQKYPKSVQTYLGMITEKDGFIPKRQAAAPQAFLEYGLSHFIMANYSHELGCSSPEVLRLGIVYYLFEEVNEIFIRSSYVSHEMEEQLIQCWENGIPLQELKTIAGKIESLVEASIPDGARRRMLTKLLFLSVIGSEAVPENAVYPKAVKEIADRYGLRL